MLGEEVEDRRLALQVTGRFVIKLIVNTAGIVSPMVASAEPSRMFTERCS